MKIKKPKKPKNLTFQVFRFKKNLKNLGFLKWVSTALCLCNRNQHDGCRNLFLNYCEFLVQEKCAQYWPVRGNDPTRYRNIDVNLMSESLMDYYVVRSFKVSAV